MMANLKAKSTDRNAAGEKVAPERRAHVEERPCSGGRGAFSSFSPLFFELLIVSERPKEAVQAPLS